ncbi:MAG: acetylxylan esterase [Bacteroidota bacterium]
MAQLSQAARDSLNKLTQADHKDMMQKLGIDKIRQGANGSDPKAPNAANYDESKANPFPILPALLIFKNGKKVNSAKKWKTRRAEIKEEFDREIYGRMPENTPKVDWQIARSTDSTIADIPVTIKRLVGKVDNSSYPKINVNILLTLIQPKNTVKKSPVIMEFSFGAFRRPGDTTRAPIPTPVWQIETLKRGWAAAILIPTSIQADNGAGLTQGIIGLMNKGERRKPDDWGSLRAWSWGAGRALEYFSSLPELDANSVAIGGHSRYGKAALVTQAYDERFAIGFISSSGEGGAKLHRRNAGELVENVAAANEYHWMAGNFIKYAGPLTWSDLPVDSHQLIAMCAPRPVFISSGNVGDAWVDVKGTFMAAVEAGPAYKLLGKKDLGTSILPKVEESLLDREISYRQHNGGHTPAPNWPIFLEYAARYFK